LHIAPPTWIATALYQNILIFASVNQNIFCDLVKFNKFILINELLIKIIYLVLFASLTDRQLMFLNEGSLLDRPRYLWMRQILWRILSTTVKSARRKRRP
jgi:hypothetical protein